MQQKQSAWTKQLLHYVKTEVLYPGSFKNNSSYAAEVIKAFEFGHKAGVRSARAKYSAQRR
jgi:hypothetical protein